MLLKISVFLSQPFLYFWIHSHQNQAKIMEQNEWDSNFMIIVVFSQKQPTPNILGGSANTYRLNHSISTFSFLYQRTRKINRHHSWPLAKQNDHFQDRKQKGSIVAQSTSFSAFDFFEVENLPLQLDNTITTILKQARLKRWNMYMYY